jgi:glycosyltransferase involved in cell wall biosynthesis
MSICAAKRLIIVPAYNEAAALPSLIQACRDKAAGWDVVVVNDGSSDETAAVVRSLGVPLLDLEQNLGIGGAMQTGFLYAWHRGYEWAVQMDGDGQHDPGQLELLWMAHQEQDCVIGSRFLGSKAFRSTSLRRLGIALLSLLIFLGSGRRIRDVTSGMRLINRKVLALFCAYYPCDYPEPESLAMLLRAGCTVREVSVDMQGRFHGVSSLAGLSGVGYMLKLLPRVALSLAFRRY